MEYHFLNCFSDFCHLFLRQNDSLSESLRSEFQNLKKISKKCFLKIIKKYFLGQFKRNTYYILVFPVHFQNIGCFPVFQVFAASVDTLFSHILAYAEPGATLAYAETWHTYNPQIFKILPYFHSNTYSELCLDENFLRTLSFLQKQLRTIFSKALHLKSLARFQIHLSLYKQSLNCGKTLRYVLYDTYSEPYLLFKNQTYSGIFRPYSDVVILWDIQNPVKLLHVQNPPIFRILYAEVYAELCHVQACSGIFRTMYNEHILRALP